MSQTILSIRIDDNLKRKFDHVCDDLGLSMTTAITMFAKKMTRENRVPFEVSLDPFYDNQNIHALKESIKQMQRGQTVTKTFKDLDILAGE